MRFIGAKHRHKAFVANNTLNFEDFPAVTETKEEIKKDLGIPFEKVVLAVGRMDEGGGRKKLDHLIKVFEQIDMPGAGLVVVGAGVGRDILQRMNKTNMLYLGEIHDPRQFQISRVFKMADVFSLPGHVGLGLNQAFFWGLPIVTEEGMQPPEIHYLVDGRNGFIVPNDDISALREKILFLLANDEERKRLSQNAREDILNHGSVQGMFEGFRQCLESLELKIPAGRNRERELCCKTD
jgi:glycosyltransferase involved in cell wall biosynthesis